MAGFRFFYKHMADLGGFVGLNDLKFIYPTVIAAIMLVVYGWHQYNKVHYGRHTQRQFNGAVTGRKLEEYFQLPEHAAGELQGMAEINVDFLENNQIRLNRSREPSRPITGYFRSNPTGMPVVPL